MKKIFTFFLILALCACTLKTKDKVVLRIADIMIGKEKEPLEKYFEFESDSQKNALYAFYNSIPKTKNVKCFTPKLQNKEMYSLFFYEEEPKKEYGTILLQLKERKVCKLKIVYPRKKQEFLENNIKVPLPPSPPMTNN